MFPLILYFAVCAGVAVWRRLGGWARAVALADWPDLTAGGDKPAPARRAKIASLLESGSASEGTFLD